jgi:vancomycin aglycone glucosyltransferase
LAALHMYPMRVLELGWLDWRITQEAENAHRRALGLPEATGASTVQRGPLEIQAYDEFCLPGPTADWVESDDRRPFIGALTLELGTAADDEILSWIDAGTPPIYFGFGSMKVTMPTDTIAMISAACAELGERALIWSGTNDFSHIPQADHVKIVNTVGQAAVFPACRAIVHHGGAGTTTASLRAGIPTLILFAFWLDQPIWAVAVEQLKVGSARHFSATTQESLVAVLSSILAPQYHTRAREVAAQMTKPAESLASAADLLEDAARQGRSG